MADFFIPNSFTSTLAASFGGSMLSEKNSGDRSFEIIMIGLPAWIVEIGAYFMRPGPWITALLVGATVFVSSMLILRMAPKIAAKFTAAFLLIKLIFYFVLSALF